MKKISPLMVLIILVALGFASFYFCKNYFGPKLNQKVTINNSVVTTTTKETGLTSNTIEFTNATLGLSFNYPAAWGEAIASEIIDLNYLFSDNPPVELENLFKAGENNENSFADFKALSREEQTKYLLKDRIEYDNFLSKELLLTFKNNDKIKIHAFNKYYLDMSGYEGSATVQPIYLGNLDIGNDLCKAEDFYKQIKINNFKLSDCEYSPNNILTISGLLQDALARDKENAYIIAAGNLKSSQEYKGLLIEYNYKTYNVAKAELLNFFGYSGYSGSSTKEIKETNLSACNSTENTVPPSTENFIQFTDKKIDDLFISDFTSYINSKMAGINGLDSNTATLIAKKWKDELGKNKGKKFSDQHAANNFYTYFDSNGALIDRINSSTDIETNFYELNPNDINCSIYKLEMQQNLDSFLEDCQKEKSILEFKQLTKGIQIN